MQHPHQRPGECITVHSSSCDNHKNCTGAGGREKLCLSLSAAKQLNCDQQRLQSSLQSASILLSRFDARSTESRKFTGHLCHLYGCIFISAMSFAELLSCLAIRYWRAKMQGP